MKKMVSVIHQPVSGIFAAPVQTRTKVFTVFVGKDAAQESMSRLLDYNMAA